MEKMGFDEFYEGLYAERWPALRKALLAEPPSNSLSEGLLKPYYLDAASVSAACALEVQDGDRVLDLCAAPGGKSLVLAAALGDGGSLVANDRSSARRARLRRVLSQHLPPDLLDRVQVTSHDASRWGLHESDAYDRVLIDVPCSSERHVLTSAPHLAKWTSARTRHLAMQAYAILAAGFAALKPGGTLVYCTCTISPAENDGVIAKLLKKQGERVLLVPPSAPCGEASEFGWIILPDRCEGLGPMYFARARKIAGATG
ncbi:MAG TPA: SAM-dependent methyltransferase [Spirochaetia bacterium]|nr:SAM-dependent methyltransferase [Spirochaetia bacterium]